jgi:hypothetical protein
MAGTVNPLGLVKYDTMRVAIEEAREVDEVKAIRDKARALEVYANQALDHEAERKVAEIRIRAERKVGELLKETKKNGARQKPGSNNGAHRGKPAERCSDAPSTLADLGISADQSSQWQLLAEIPSAEFEDAIHTSSVGPQSKPTTEGVLNAAKAKRRKKLSEKFPAPPPCPPEALWMWGRICDFEKLLDHSASELYRSLEDFQQRQMEEIVPQLITWLEEMLP